MAQDVANLQAIILSDLNNRAAPTSAQMLTEIQASIKDYEAYRFYFNERVCTRATVSGTASYAINLFDPSGVTDIIEVDQATVTVNTSNIYELDPITYAEYARLQSNTTLTGYPEKYAIFNQTVYLYPTPNGVYTITISAHVRFTEVTTGTDSNAWTADGRELIRRSALKRLYGTLIKDEVQAQLMAVAEQQALASLDRRTDALSGSRVDWCL